jgi:hypothetical protein
MVINPFIEVYGHFSKIPIIRDGYHMLSYRIYHFWQWHHVWSAPLKKFIKPDMYCLLVLGPFSHLRPLGLKTFRPPFV